MADQHVETTMIPGRRLGRRAPKNAPAVRLRGLLTGDIPSHPVSAEHFSEVSDWGLYANDTYGDCGPTSVANQRRLVTRYLADTEQDVTLQDVFDLYRRSGNPGFDPVTGYDDNGVDMQTMLEAVHDGGIAGVKCVAFAKVDPSNLDEIRAAIAIFGSLLLGVDLETSQQAQTADGVWDYAPSSQWGGHAVLGGAYTSSTSGPDVSVITWAEVVGTTDAFWENQVQEAWVVIWPEHLGTREFQEGIDVQALAADYYAVTGRPLPLPPQPIPVPPPNPLPDTPTVADQIFAAALHEWLHLRHHGASIKLAADARDWLDAKGLL